MKNKILLWVILLAIFASCSSELDQIKPDNQSNSVKRSSFISMEEAKGRLPKIIKGINAQMSNDVNRFPECGSTVNVKSAVALDANRMPLTRGASETDAMYYVFRLDNGTFAIMSATREMPELLALGKGNPNFEDPDANLPNPDYWSLSDETWPTDTGSAKNPMPTTGYTVVKEPIIRSVEVPALCKVKWGNAYPYNMFLEPDTLYDDEGKVTDYGTCAVGCVAIAVAQLMSAQNLWGASYKGHNYDFQWLSTFRDSQAFETDNAAKKEIARLMKELGLPENLDMEYHLYCSWSYSSLVPNVLNKYGFTSSQVVTFNVDSINAELKRGYPVYLSSLGWGKGDPDKKLAGHAWICHGLLICIEDIDIYETEENYLNGDMPIWSGTRTSYYHQMNWGWDGDGDGYYLIRARIDNIKGPDIPEDNTNKKEGWTVQLRNSLDMIYHIRPKQPK